MSVFSDCIKRIAGLFGDGPKPPDCCTDWTGGDGGGDDDDQDDGDERCIDSCASYGFCKRNDPVITGIPPGGHVGTTSIETYTICYNDLPPEIKLTLTCDTGGQFTDWPPFVSVGGVGSGGDVLYQYIAGQLEALGMQSPAQGILGGSPSDCETFKCDFAHCPPWPQSASCPNSSCIEDLNLPSNTYGYFKCSSQIGSPCRNDCDQVFNLDFNPIGTKHRTMAACLASDCCMKTIDPDDRPGDVVQDECFLWRCDATVGLCSEVVLTKADLAAKGWDYDVLGCPIGDPTPLIGYYETENGCNTRCPKPGTPTTTPPQPNICVIYECDDCESECTQHVGDPATLNANLNLGLINPQTCNDIQNSVQTPPFYTTGGSCNNACKYDEEICRFSMCKDFQNPAIRRCVVVFNGARNIFNNINAGLAGTTIAGPDCPNCDSISDWIGNGRVVGNDRYFPLGGCVDCERVDDIGGGSVIDGGNTGGGGGGGGAGAGGANPFDDPTGTATGITFDGGNTGGGGGGGGSNIGVTAIDFNSNNLEDPTNTQSLIGSDGIRREYVGYDSNRAINPNLSNLPRIKSRDFIGIRNIGFRKDIFADTIHYSIDSIDKILSNNLPYSDIPFSELSIANLKQSLSTSLTSRFDQIKESKDGRDLILRIVRRIKKHIFEGSVYDIDYSEIINLLDNFNRKDLKFRTQTLGEVAAVNHMIENARTVDISKYTEAPKEEIRLWKLVATDVEKHLPVLLTDGSLDKVFIDQDDSFDLTLSDGSTDTSYISDGDVYNLATPGYVAVQYPRDRTVILDLDDTEKIFNYLGQDYSTTLEVSTLESDDVEATADLTTPRQDVYMLKLDPTSMEDLERDNDLIRVTRSKYTLMDEADVDDWIKFKPFPFSTFYLDHEDPFFDHLEISEHIHIVSKDFSMDSFEGYQEDIPYLPRRIPWSVAIIATDRIDLQDGVSRSALTSLSSRSVTFIRKSTQKEVGTRHPLYNLNLVGYGEGAVPDAPTNNQIRFSFDKSKLKDIGTTIKTTKPRKASPVRELITALRESKTEQAFIDARGTTVPWPVVFNKMSVSARKRLSKEVLNYRQFKSKVALNKLAKDETIKNTFPKVSNVPVLDDDKKLETFTFTKRTTKIDSDYIAEDIQPL